MVIFVPMKRERIIIFLSIVAAIFVAPQLLPYLIGGIVLPVGAYLIYGIVVLVNAALYWVNRAFLIDRYIVRGKMWLFLVWNFVLISIGLAIQYFAIVFLEPRMDGIDFNEILNLSARISQGTLAFCMELLVIVLALAVAFSDQWRRAAFRFNESQKDIDRLQGQVDSLKKQQRKAPEADSLTVKVDLVMTRVVFDDILYVKSDGDYVVIHKADGKKLMTLSTLKALEKQLPFDRFCRTHRSYLVNADRIQGMKEGKILVGADTVPLSDSCKPAFFEMLSHKSIVLKTNA